MAERQIYIVTCQKPHLMHTFLTLEGATTYAEYLFADGEDDIFVNEGRVDPAPLLAYGRVNKAPEYEGG